MATVGRKVRRAETSLRLTEGRRASDEELSRIVDLETRIIQRTYQANLVAHTTSLDAPMGENGDTNLGELKADERVIQPEEFSLRREVINLLNRGCLDERQKVVLEDLFIYGHTFKEIGSKLGVSKVRARQIKEEAIKILRTYTSKHGIIEEDFFEE